jgi:RNA polymerase sigma-54 factor
VYSSSINEEEFERILKIVQGFEPSGVASRSVQECLVNQLLEKKSSPTLETAVVILRECFSLLEQKKEKRFQDSLGSRCLLLKLLWN